MAQNTSPAVMAQRKEPHDSLEHFPTPPWAARALCEWLIGQGFPIISQTVWEPACAEGYMAAALGEYFRHVEASDVHDYGYGGVQDFLIPMAGESRPDWIITNPPFRLAAAFIERATALAGSGCAMLVRTAFLEGADRHRRLFSKHPPFWVLQFVERVPMFKGRLSRSLSTATAYCWLVWRPRCAGTGTRLEWIAPCRRRLERFGDYPEDHPEEAA